MTRNGIYLYGYYGQGNLGDDLLMMSALRMIRAVRPDAPVFVHCHHAAWLPALGDTGVVPIETSAVLADQTVLKPLRLGRYIGLLAHTFRSCATLVFGGGTVLQESRSPLSILLIAAMVTVARIRGLDIVLIGAGLGEFRTSWGRWAARHVLRRVQAAAFRDAESLERARLLVPDCPAVLTSDLVYALDGPHRSDPISPSNTIALSIQPSVTERGDDQGERIKAMLRDVVQELLRENRRVRLLVFESKGADDRGIDDARAWRALLGDMLNRPESPVTLTKMPGGALDADTICQQLFEGTCVHVGMRFHGHVLASQAGVPFVGLSHDTKIAEICRMFSMPCLALDQCSPADVLNAIMTAENRAVSAQTTDALRSLSLTNQDVLASVLVKG